MKDGASVGTRDGCKLRDGSLVAGTLIGLVLGLPGVTVGPKEGLPGVTVGPFEGVPGVTVGPDVVTTITVACTDGLFKASL